MTVPVIELIALSDSGGSTVASLTVTAPASITADELLVIFVGSDDTGSDAEFSINDTTYPGWTKLGEGGAGPSQAHLGIFYKIAGGSESDVVVDAASSDEMIGWYLRVSGVDTVTPVDVSDFDEATGSSGWYHLTGMATTVADCLVISGFAADGGDLTPFGTISGSGWAKVSGAENNSGTTGTDVSGDLAFIELSGTGTPANASAGFAGGVIEGSAYGTIAIAPLGSSATVSVTSVGSTAAVGDVTVTTGGVSVTVNVTGVGTTGGVGSYQPTYYANGSPVDAQSVWTDDSFMFDGLTTQGASCSTTGSASNNALFGQGANAASSGPLFGVVEGRIHGFSSVGGEVDVDFHSPIGDEYLGTAIRDQNTDGWGDYSNLSEPSIGWTWGQLKQLYVYAYVSSGSGTVNRPEVRVNIHEALGDANVAVTGVEATSGVGAVTVGIGRSIDVTGLSTAASVGETFVLAIHVPNQIPNYSEENPTQTPNWSEIAPTQNPNFTEVTPT